MAGGRKPDYVLKVKLRDASQGSTQGQLGAAWRNDGFSGAESRPLDVDPDALGARLIYGEGGR